MLDINRGAGMSREREEMPEKINPAFMEASRSDFRPEPHNISSDKPKGRKGRWGLLFIVIAFLGGYWLGDWLGVLPWSTFPKIDGDRTQAVFLNNGLIYFGHLKNVNRSYLALENGYYIIQNQADPKQQQQPNFTLVKIEDEVYKPDSIMYIAKAQISFWENLADDSPVIKTIKQAGK